MSLLNGVLVLAHVCTLIQEYGCVDTFTKVGDTSLLLVKEKFPFGEAERHCAAKDSKLIEFWSIAEWKEVKTALIPIKLNK